MVDCGQISWESILIWGLGGVDERKPTWQEGEQGLENECWQRTRQETNVGKIAPAGKPIFVDKAGF